MKSDTTQKVNNNFFDEAMELSDDESQESEAAASPSPGLATSALKPVTNRGDSPPSGIGFTASEDGYEEDYLVKTIDNS
jgi:hypothetical protein